MNPTTTTEAGAVADVAAKLTEAQREALTDVFDLGDLGYMTKIATGRSAKALHQRGLTRLSWAPCTLTPLGLAVRQHLEQGAKAS